MLPLNLFVEIYRIYYLGFYYLVERKERKNKSLKYKRINYLRNKKQNYKKQIIKEYLRESK